MKQSILFFFLISNVSNDYYSNKLLQSVGLNASDVVFSNSFRLKDDSKIACDFPEISLTWRRYSEFEQLQQYLQAEYSYIIIPPLPEKKSTHTWRNPNRVVHDVTDPDFVDRRRAGLEV